MEKPYRRGKGYLDQDIRLLANSESDIQMTTTIALIILAFVPPPFEATVTDVHDGDTIKVAVAGEPEKIEIRLYGIDAPEIKTSTKTVDGKRVETKYNNGTQPYGFTARAKLSQLVYGKKVTVITETNARTYGRTVARIKCEGLDINLKMVEIGMAWWYQAYAKNDTQLQSAQTQAKAARRGLWSEPLVIAPWDFRKKLKLEKAK
jgi:endonuclease YncB( thermonuclease family)